MKFKRFMTAVSRFICNFITWFSVIIAVAGVAVFFVPKLFGYYPFVVLSGSMEPTVHVGSLAYVDLYRGEEEPVADEVLAYRTKDGTMVLHRLMGMSDTGYVFKGDANETEDAATVNRDNIVGKYVMSVPKLGYVGAWVSNTTVGFGMIMVPAVVLILAGLLIASNVLYFIISMLCDDSN